MAREYTPSPGAEASERPAGGALELAVQSGAAVGVFVEGGRAEPDGATEREVEMIADLVSAMFDRAVLACNAGADARAYEDALASLLTMLTCQCDRTAFSNVLTP